MAIPTPTNYASTTPVNLSTGKIIASLALSPTVTIGSTTALRISINLSSAPEGRMIESCILSIYASSGSGTLSLCETDLSLSEGEAIPLFVDAASGCQRYRADISASVSKRQGGICQFLLKSDSPVTVYTSLSDHPLRKASASLTTYESGLGLFSRSQQSRLEPFAVGRVSLFCDAYSGELLMRIPLFEYSDALDALPFYLSYGHPYRFDASPDGVHQTGFPSGLKLSAQQFVYQDGNDYIYIDADFRKHAFKRPTGSSDAQIWYDSCGSYLTLRPQGQYLAIRDAVGNVLWFLGGLLVSMEFVHGTGSTEFSVSHDALGRVVSLSRGAEVLLSVSYASGDASISSFWHGSALYSVCQDQDGCVSSVSVPSGESYYFDIYNDKISGVSLGGEAVEITYDSVNRVVSFARFFGGVRKMAERFSYLPRETELGFASSSGASPYRNDRVSFLLDGSVSASHSEIGGLVRSSFERFRDGRLSYDLSSDSPAIPLTVRGGDGLEIELSSSPQPVSDGLDLYVNGDFGEMCFMSVDIEQSVPLLAAGSIYQTLAVSAYIGGASVASRSIELKPWDGRKRLIIPIESRLMASFSGTLAVEFESSSAATLVSVSGLRFHVWDSPIRYFRRAAAGADALYSDATLGIPDGMMPFELQRSQAESLSLTPGSLSVSPTEDDWAASMLYSSNGEHILFYSSGASMVYIGEADFISSGLSGSLLQSYKFAGRLGDEGAGAPPYSSITIDTLSYGSVLQSSSTLLDLSLGTSSSSLKTSSAKGILTHEERRGPDDEVTSSVSYTNNSYGEPVRSEASYADGSTVSSPVTSYSADGTRISSVTSQCGSLSVSVSYQHGGGDQGRNATVAKSGLSPEYIEYDAEGRPSLIQMEQMSNSIGYCERGVSSVTSNGANAFSFAYDWSGVSSLSHANRSMSSLSLPLQNGGMEISGSDLNGIDFERRYDPLGRLSESFLGESHAIFFYDGDSQTPSDVYCYSFSQSSAHLSVSRDAHGRPSSMSDGDVSVSLSYSVGEDSMGRFHLSHSSFFEGEASEPFREEASKSYSSASSPSAFSTSVGGREVACLSTPSGQAGTIIRTVTATGRSISCSFSSYLELAQSGGICSPFVSKSCFRPNGLSADEVEYSYGQHGFVTSVAQGNGYFSRSYSYSASGALSSETSTGFGCIEYYYDQFGNMIRKKIDGVVAMEATYDGANQIVSLSVGGAQSSCSYDQTTGLPTMYKGNQLALCDGLLTGYGDVSFSYDAFGRRVSKSVMLGDSSEYVYIGGRLIKETRHIGSDDHEIQFVYSGDEIVGMFLDGYPYVYEKDIFGNVISIRDALSQNLIARYLYDGYGNCEIRTIEGMSDYQFISSINPIRYRSYYYDVETGLYLLGRRYYDPKLGRFLTPDGADFIEPTSIKGTNLYCYCLNNPVMYCDPTGRMPITVAMLLIGIGVGAAIGAVTNIVSQYISNGGWDNFSWASLSWSILIGGASGALAMSTLGTAAMVAANAILSTIGSVGNHLIAGDDFSSCETWSDIVFSLCVGVVAGILGGQGALHDNNVSAAATQFAKATRSYMNVISKVSAGGYATIRGANIALGIARNNFIRALNGFCFSASSAGGALIQSLYISALTGIGGVFAGGMIA